MNIDQWIVNHVCLFHIFGSVFLFVCAFKVRET